MNQISRVRTALVLSATAISCVGTPNSNDQSPISVSLHSTVRVALERTKNSNAAATVLGVNDGLPAYVALPEDVLVQFSPGDGFQSLVISNKTEFVLKLDARYCLKSKNRCGRPESITIGPRGFSGILLSDGSDLAYLSNFKLDDAR